MSEGAGNKIPKTLADVSHLFFSKVEESAQPAPSSDRADPTGPSGRGVLPERFGEPARGPRRGERRERPRVVVVTGGDDAPGKSTVAVNLAQGLLPWGRVALIDADPALPNARFYLGLPSWNYLSPVTGGGKPAPTSLLDSGLVVADWAPAACDPSALVCEGDTVHLDLGEDGRQRFDYVVVDLPSRRAGLLDASARRAGRLVVVAAPGWAGFRAAFEAASVASKGLGLRAVDLVVNRVPDDTYAGAYHRKFNMATRDLLSVESRLLAGVGCYAGLGCEQRERGPIVRSRPDAAPALALRNAASAIAGSQSLEDRAGTAPAPQTESAREDENSEIGTS
jgi:MinD-like ATPase involved in chromosome partitioning or flagellar assembly